MIRHKPRQSFRVTRRGGRIPSILVAITCLLRGLPHFFSAVPGTPLRVLCMIAFDTLHVLRRSQPLSHDRLRTLAALLNFGACANAALDSKAYCVDVHDAARQHDKKKSLRTV